MTLHLLALFSRAAKERVGVEAEVSFQLMVIQDHCRSTVVGMLLQTSLQRTFLGGFKKKGILAFGVVELGNLLTVFVF